MTSQHELNYKLINHKPNGVKKTVFFKYQKVSFFENLRDSKYTKSVEILLKIKTRRIRYFIYETLIKMISF